MVANVSSYLKYFGIEEELKQKKSERDKEPKIRQKTANDIAHGLLFTPYPIDYDQIESGTEKINNYVAEFSEWATENDWTYKPNSKLWRDWTGVLSLTTKELIKRYEER